MFASEAMLHWQLPMRNNVSCQQLSVETYDQPGCAIISAALVGPGFRKKKEMHLLLKIFYYLLCRMVSHVCPVTKVYIQNLCLHACVFACMCVSMRKVPNGIGVVHTAIGPGADDSLISSVVYLHSGTSPDHWAL